MEKEHYAAIAAYDYSLQKNETTKSTFLLILDLSEIEGALCTVSEDGNVDIKELVASQGKATMFSRIAEKIKCNETETHTLWREQLRDINRKLEAHIRNSERNYPVLQMKDSVLNCADLVEMFEQDGNRIKDLLRAVEAMLRRNGVDEDDLRILLCGREASFAPAEYTVRSFFCTDPWLADDRFVMLDPGTDPALLVQLGESILQELENRSFGHDIDVICRVNISNGNDMPEKLINIGAKEQQIKSMNDPEYKVELYLTDRTKLSLLIDGKRVRFSLRNRGIYEGVYRAGLRLADKQPELCFQRADDSMEQIYIPISI